MSPFSLAGLSLKESKRHTGANEQHSCSVPEATQKIHKRLQNTPDRYSSSDIFVWAYFFVLLCILADILT